MLQELPDVGQLRGHNRRWIAAVTRKVAGILPQQRSRRCARGLRGVPHWRAQLHHLVHAAQCVKRCTGATQAPRVEAPVLCIPGDEAASPIQGQLGTLVQYLQGAIGAEPLDPQKVHDGTAVLQAAIRVPNAKHVFGGG
ncbi:MAG: hypothetical protein ACLQGT_08300 [Terracidiphilus sp.]